MDSEKDKKNSLILVSQQIFNSKKNEAAGNAAWRYTKAIVDFSVASSSALYVYAMHLTTPYLLRAPFYMMAPYISLAVVAFSVSAFMLYATCFEAYKGTGELNKYFAYNSSGNEIIDFDKLAGKDSPEIAISHLIRLRNANDDLSMEVKKKCAKDIFKSYKLDSKQTLGNDNDIYVNFLPYSRAYVEEQKNNSYYSTLQSAGAALVSFVAAGLSANYTYNIVTIGLSRGLWYQSPSLYMALFSPKLLFSAVTLFALCFTADNVMSAYDNYKQMKLYSNLASNLTLTEGNTPKISYSSQDLFNKILDKMLGENKQQMKEAVTSFREMVNIDRAAASLGR